MSYYYGASFQYNGIPSELYDLRILNFETNSVGDSPAGSDAVILQKFIVRKPKPYLFGVTRNTPLEISMTIGSGDYISGETRSKIEQWLLGAQSFLPLQIIQSDISDTILYTIFTKSEVKYIGNLMVGLTLHGQVNAPWAYTYPKSLVKNYGPSFVVGETFNFYNYSDDTDYLYPQQLKFTTNSIGNGFTLTNNSDLTGSQMLAGIFEGGGGTVVPGGPRVFQFSNISANETITVDCYKQTITSSTGLKRMANFNRKFFRLIQGNNSLTMVGGISNFTMTYSFAKKIGA